MEATTIKFEDVKMFKNPQLSPRNDGQWVGVFEDKYDVEVRGNKARVFSNNPFNHKPSRFAKLQLCGGSDEMNTYMLRVNGCKAFFKIPYKIS